MSNILSIDLKDFDEDDLLAGNIIYNETGKTQVISINVQENERGPRGYGVPAGGSNGQIIVKQSDQDYDMAWTNLNVPTKTSDLTNDSGFITASNIPVTSVNGQTGDVTVNVPTRTSQLVNDSTYQTADNMLGSIQIHNVSANAHGDIRGKVSTIEGLIPNQASTSNQLADKNFVNSSVQTATANFRGNWDTWAQVPSDVNDYPADYAGNKTPTVNDYLVVQDASTPILPDTYQGVEYIETTGTQWINTGLNGNMSYTYELDFQQTSASNYRNWGVFGQSGYQGPNMSLTWSTGFAVRWESQSGQSRLVDNLETVDSNRHKLKIVNGAVYWDGSYKGKSAGHQDNYVVNYPLFLGTINPGGTTPTSNSHTKFYAYSVKDTSGTLVQNLVPCKRKSDNVVGMFDTVSNTFFTNAGTDSFAAGDNVVPTGLEGTWRYKYTGTWAVDGKAGWQPEYQVNETPLTAAQLAALNSGITAGLVANIPTVPNIVITIGVDGNENMVWSGADSIADVRNAFNGGGSVRVEAPALTDEIYNVTEVLWKDLNQDVLVVQSLDNDASLIQIGLADDYSVEMDNVNLQERLQAGSNISIVGNTISATVPTITVDSEIDSSSTNPVQNQALYDAIVGKEIIFPVDSSLWSEPSGTNPYVTNAIVTLPSGSFTDNCMIELMIDDKFNDFAKYGFILYGYETASQRIWLTALEKPTQTIYLKIKVYTYGS